MCFLEYGVEERVVAVRVVAVRAVPAAQAITHMTTRHERI
jgi:hypothetical protein